MRFDYIDIVRGLIDTIEERESEHMEQCVELLATCVREKHSIYTFGASHAGILSEEMYYRAGGLMLMNPIFGREIMLDTAPITHTVTWSGSSATARSSPAIRQTSGPATSSSHTRSRAATP